MFHLVWDVLIGLISGVIAKSVMHVHIALFWTIVLGIIGSVIGGCVTHMFSRPANARYHPAGLIFSTSEHPIAVTFLNGPRFSSPSLVFARQCKRIIGGGRAGAPFSRSAPSAGPADRGQVHARRWAPPAR